ncbi:M28 family peptidase [Planctomicrobium sp. SH661]|uniref:M28 family peptidase n=1 Tax=Planctomicrobium sp. SH661 TaxID=3448124 RepID=UPI003F5CAA44
MKRSSNLISTSLLLSALLFLFAGHAIAEELSPSARQMLEDVKILASDEFEGRGVGTEGLNKAAAYIAEQFEKAGLIVTADQGDPYQEFEINDGARLGEPNLLTLHGPDGKTIELKYDQDFRTCAFGGSGKFDAPVVFVGYGIDAPDVEYSDFAGVDIKDKVVIIMRRNPLQNDPHGPFAVGHGISRHAALTTKVSQAFTRGAVAVLIVNDPMTGTTKKQELSEQVEKARQQVIEVAQKMTEVGAKADDFLNELRHALDHLKQVQSIHSEHVADPLMAFGYGGSRSGKSIPCFQITQEVCNQMLLSATGNNLAEIETQIDESNRPMSRPLAGWTASGEATVNIVKVPVKNVIGVLEGEGPLSQETIVVGAHFDHLGRGAEGSLASGNDVKEIHNGADDNASGTAGLLELARRLAKRDRPLPRRIVFIAFTGEERGLLGSVNYVDSPLFPLEQTVAMFNMDMIGRMEENKLVVFGTGTSGRWDPLVDSLATAGGLDVSKKPEGFGPSDHSSFYGKDIPVLHLFTGTHSDYHRPSDDWEKINAADMERVIGFLETIVLETAVADTRPDFIKVKGTATLERTGSRPYFGSIPDFGKEADGYAIQGVSPDSPADKAGLKGGDVIIRIGENRVGGLDDFDLALRNYKPGEQVKVVVLRAGQEVTLNVTLSTPRG